MRKFQRIATVCVLALALVAFVQPISRARIVNVYQDVSFKLHPSADRAYAYGISHFDALHSASYDINRARYFFLQTLLLDPSHPTVYHQLSRIAFLEGNFDNALELINIQIAQHGDIAPSSYYIRGLISGFNGDYESAVRDYETYLGYDPHNWAAINDLAWVLLKSGWYQYALEATAAGLQDFPENPWLMNSHATALFELGRYAEALQMVRGANAHVQNVTEREWLRAYPGNDPQAARAGVAAFKAAVQENMHTIEKKIAEDTVQ